MSNIIALSSKSDIRQKAAYNLVLGKTLSDYKISDGKWSLLNNGDLWLEYLLGSKVDGIFDYYRDNLTTRGFLFDYVNPYLKIYDLESLPKLICVNILGLDKERVFHYQGDLTQYHWEDCFGIITNAEWWFSNEDNLGDFKVKYHPEGRMTIAELLEYISATVLQGLNVNAYVNATIKEIRNDSPELAIITNVKYPYEVERLKECNAKVVRITKQEEVNVSKRDNALDDYSGGGFDFVLNNEEMGIEEQSRALLGKFVEWGMIPK